VTSSAAPPSEEKLDLHSLRALLDGDDARDRAFVDAMTRIRWSRAHEPSERAELEELHRATKNAAQRSHSARRLEVASGSLRGAALRKYFDELPLLERDHAVEELLGIAYPPLVEPELERELVGYSPSGYDEIVHALDVTGLGAGDRFVDLGCGLGKAVLLAGLLTGASCSGIEQNEQLCRDGQQVCRELRLDGAVLQHGDAREAALGDPDVVFMYLPFTGGALTAVLARLMAHWSRSAARGRRRYLCAGALDLERYPALVPAGPAKSWLHVYAWR
jgi:SAM-dependent methyltransferase